MLQQSAAALQQQTRRGLRQRRTSGRRPRCQWRQQTTLPSGRMGRLMQTSPVHCWPAVRQRKTWGRQRPVQRSCRRPPPWRLLPWLPWLHMAGSVASVSCDGTKNIPPLQSESRTRQIGGKQAIPRPLTPAAWFFFKKSRSQPPLAGAAFSGSAHSHTTGSKAFLWSQGSSGQQTCPPTRSSGWWEQGGRQHAVSRLCCAQGRCYSTTSTPTRRRGSGRSRLLAVRQVRVGQRRLSCLSSRLIGLERVRRLGSLQPYIKEHRWHRKL